MVENTRVFEGCRFARIFPRFERHGVQTLVQSSPRTTSKTRMFLKGAYLDPPAHTWKNLRVYDLFGLFGHFWAFSRNSLKSM